MPVEFLTDEQVRRYGRFDADPSLDQLERYFFLDDHDRGVAARKRDDRARLGFGVQLATVRFLGTFLTDPTEVPEVAVRYVAGQLGINDPRCLDGYGSIRAHWEHAGEIKRRYGYRDFHDRREYLGLIRWLFERAWLGGDRPSVLLDLATARCVDRNVLLPGVTVMARLVARVRARANARAWRLVGRQVGADAQKRLDSLLAVDARSQVSMLQLLRRGSRNPTVAGLVEAIERLVAVRQLDMGTVDMSVVPASRVRAMAQYGKAADAQTVARLADGRRIATLVALVATLEIEALDDVLDAFDVVMGTLLARVDRVGQRERLRTLRDFDTAALTLRQVCLLVLDPAVTDAELRHAVFAQLPRPKLEAAANTVETLASRPGDHHYSDLLSRYPHVRRFQPQLAAVVRFEASSAGEDVLEAWRYLTDAEGTTGLDADTAPMAVVSAAWRPHVSPKPGVVNRRAYTLCVLEALRTSLRRRDIHVAGSRRWADPTAQLINPEAWPKTRARVCRTLNRDRHPGPELAALTSQLDAAYRRTAENLATNTDVAVVDDTGRDRLKVTPLDPVDEPDTLKKLRGRVASLLPRVELPEVLLEVANWTGMTNEFTHVSGAGARINDFGTSLCAVLVAEACNIGWRPLVRDDHPALTRDRLGWVEQHYIRPETLAAANSRLVDYQANIPLAQKWGGGEVASADGLRFIVPVRSLHTRPNRRYFSVGRGVTYYNFTSDQFTGFAAIVIPGTLRDSMFILDGLLGNTTSLDPTEVMADTAAYSDVIFGLFWLLGYQFSPRLADIGSARLWRIDPEANYGSLNGVARNRINTDLIADQWDELLRIAGSLATSTVTASDLMRTLHRGPRASTLAKALAELGRIIKTLYLLTYIDDEHYRRRILTQLNRHESRHALARAIFHGQRGHLRRPYRTGQEEQLGALGLVVNAVALWNTRYIDAALNHLTNNGHDPDPADIARLSPLTHDHINFHGRYQFHLPDLAANGDLRPLTTTQPAP
jgi:TnpA family transposase